MRKLLIGVQAGVLGGATVGVIEAVYLLSSAGDASDYVALVYASVLYACIGLGQGVGLGVVLAVLSKVWKGLTDERAWALAYLGAFCSLALVITMFLANKVVYAEQGVPMSGKLMILGGYGLDFLIGMWLLPILLEKTPLRILLQPKGSAAAYGLLVVICGIFSFAAGGSADVAPERMNRSQADLAERPNVLLIVVDTLRADYLQPYDDSHSTPTIQALADDGIVFERAHANASWTRASFANMYTSMIPSTHTTALKSSRLPDDVVTLAEVMQGHDYATGGLPNNTNVTGTFGFAQGFDHYPYLSPNLPFGATESVYQLSMYSVLRKVGERMKGDSHVVEDFYQGAPAAITKAEEFIDVQAEDRWFLMMHLMEPHDPYFERPYNGTAYGRAEHEVPEVEKLDYLKETYATEISHMDADLAAFFDAMKADGSYDDTLIILTADHGEEFMEHDGWWHGTTLFQEQIHVPLIVKLPGQAHAGTRAPWVVRHIDIAPTIADLAGAELPDSWQGAPLIDDDFDAFVTPPEPVYESDENGDFTGEPVEVPPEVAGTAIDGRDFDRIVLAEEDFEGNQVIALRRGDWKMQRANDGNPRGLDTEALYDLQFDAGEQKNERQSSSKTYAELDEEAKKQLMTASGVAVQAAETEMDAATIKQLCNLGYMDCD
ncbi:MAG: sulfatase [Proteobacteria bacterium]|nr:sulfatase [Pseudomonadota bacterium]MCP4915486.1 sulfatase [Pseudomonadota bacterium]